MKAGTIASFVAPDGIGRVHLDDGAEVKFAMPSMRNVVPRVGVRVQVGAVVDHPLGGFRALEVVGTDSQSDVDAYFEDAKRAWEAAREPERARMLFGGQPAVGVTGDARDEVCRQLASWKR